ncbi:MAG TPA: N-acetylmuramic acid 6-phosphate etherase [Terrimicrobiaceae bacterium]
MSKQIILGIDGGATKTDWALCEMMPHGLRPVKEGRLGPGSMKLLDPVNLQRLLGALPREVSRVGVFLAGCATAQDRSRLEEVASSIWPDASIRVGSDRESGFAAAFGNGDGIAVIAGTGSAVTGRKAGSEDRAGGWGHLLGDSGGGYDLAIRALRRVLFDFDTGHRITALARDILRTLGLNTLRDLTTWAQTAQKNDLARLTPLLFEHEPEVREILQEGAETLALLAAAVCRRLEFPRPSVQLMGGVFLNHPLYARLFTETFAREWPGSEIAVCRTPASLGAALIASDVTKILPRKDERLDEVALHRALTEERNPRSRQLDRMSLRDLVSLFVHEERRVEEALAGNADALVAAIKLATRSLENGGRLFYAGAGTSGRLGVLDASEMPPTFGLSPDRVQAIIAGGAPAIQASVEGAEDDSMAGTLAVQERGVAKGDAVCGITASGRTPFVRGALQAARAAGAGTILLTCNPNREKGSIQADVEIDLPTGPELITGSTRLKAGTATKVALNILSSCVMIRLGRVDGNLMACLQPTNKKLRDRATRIVAERLALSTSKARSLLECANWNIRNVLIARRSRNKQSQVG